MRMASARARRSLTAVDGTTTGRMGDPPGPTKGLASRSRRRLRDVAEFLGLRERLQLLQRLVLDLADPLARHVERAADLVQRAGMLAAEAVAQLEHPTFAVGEVLQRLAQGL